MWTDNIIFNYKTCKNESSQSYILHENVISLYVVLTNSCNANCPFCAYNDGKTSKVDLEIFRKRYKELYDICRIQTVHFTGGEPTLELDTLKEILSIVKETDEVTKTSCNTNGSRLKELVGLDKLDNIALSRHHYLDSRNQELFCTNVPSTEELKGFKEKKKLHFSCNLIKDYIDSKEELEKYLNFVADIGINDVGIVSLMKVNDFCNKHYVDFDSMSVEQISNLIKTRCYSNVVKDEVVCHCDNYLYQAKNMNLLSLYHRHAIKNDTVADYLVYKNNHIQQGFKGKMYV